jgi:uncharacterized protein YukJ
MPRRGRPNASMGNCPNYHFFDNYLPWRDGALSLEKMEEVEGLFLAFLNTTFYILQVYKPTFLYGRK